jgi:hypothetical protein
MIECIGCELKNSVYCDYCKLEQVKDGKEFLKEYLIVCVKVFGVLTLVFFIIFFLWRLL